LAVSSPVVGLVVAGSRGNRYHAARAGEATDGSGHERRGLLVPTRRQLRTMSAWKSKTASIFAPGAPKAYSTPCAVRASTTS
jgi:hypothetical protein